MSYEIENLNQSADLDSDSESDAWQNLSQDGWDSLSTNAAENIASKEDRFFTGTADRDLSGNPLPRPPRVRSEAELRDSALGALLRPQGWNNSHLLTDQALSSMSAYFNRTVSSWNPFRTNFTPDRGEILGRCEALLGQHLRAIAPRGSDFRIANESGVIIGRFYDTRDQRYYRLNQGFRLSSDGRSIDIVDSHSPNRVRGTVHLQFRAR